MRRLVVGMTALACLMRPMVATAQPPYGQYTVIAQGSVKILAGATLSHGAVSCNGTVFMRGATLVGPVAADELTLDQHTTIQGSAFFNSWNGQGAIAGPTHSPVPLPIIPLTPPIMAFPGMTDIVVPAGATQTIPSGVYRSITIHSGAHVTLDPQIELDSFVMRSGSVPAELTCNDSFACFVAAKTRVVVDGNVGVSGSPVAFQQESSKTIVVGGPGAYFNGGVFAPVAKVKLRSSKKNPATYKGYFEVGSLLIGKGAIVDGGVTTSICGDLTITSPEQCDPPNDSACPGECLPTCFCPVIVPPVLHSVGPSVLHNATDFGVQIFGKDFIPGAQLELSDKTTTAVIATLPTTFVSSTELTALVPAGLPVPSGIQRELAARIINPGRHVRPARHRSLRDRHAVFRHRLPQRPADARPAPAPASTAISA